MKAKIIIIAIALLIVISLSAWYFLAGTEVSEDIIVKPETGLFKQTVTTTGELKAKNSIDIQGPSNARAVRIYQMKISKLVPEGTTVKKGDFVAELDKTEIMNKIKDEQLNIQKLESQLLQAKLDSALTLSAARDELENLKFALEEKQLLMKQSTYEPPAIVRQAEIDYERSQRALKQAKKNYITREEQSEAKMAEVWTDLTKLQQSLQNLMEIMQKFSIDAPADGMVIYAREWNGKRKTVGSEISSWDPVVATLPDLSKMQSATYVNEVDIQKIKEGQESIVKLDANPDKNLTGEISRVANIGEQRKNSDSKVFEVVIDINEKDTTLLPSMTTSNEIIIQTIDSALFIPIECVHTIEDEETGEKTNFVYKKDNGGFIRQEVKLGIMSETKVVIEKGLTSEDEIYLSIPPNSNESELVLLTGGDEVEIKE